MKWILAAVLILVSAIILNVLIRIFKIPDAILNIDYYADGPNMMVVYLHPIENLKNHKRITMEVRTRDLKDQLYNEEATD